MIKLLIADDEALEREAIKYIVNAHFPGCFDIRETANGRETIAQADQFRPDLLFLDIKMPGCNGIEAAQEIRVIVPECRIIILSAYHYFNYAQSAISFGADEYLTKPAAPAKIVETVTRVLKLLDESRVKKIQDAATTRRLEQISNYLEEQLLDQVLQGNSEKALELLAELLGWCTDQADELPLWKEKVSELLMVFGRKLTDNANLEDFAIDLEALRPAIFALESSFEIQQYAANFITANINEISQLKKSRAGVLLTIVRDYLEANYAREISLEEVAASVQISPFYLSKLFKKEFGENFIDYLTGIRIRKAKEILANPLHTVKDACYLVGYHDPNYFARVFKKMVGMTPTEYQSKSMR